MKNAVIILSLVVSIGSLYGCSTGTSEMTATEAQTLKDSKGKAMPKEVAEKMNGAGAMVEKQMKENAAAGVDAQGIPLNKGGNAGAPAAPNGGAPTGSAGK